MKTSIAVSLLLVASNSFANATKETMKIRKSGVKFKVNWWDDGRSVPYQIYFKKQGVKAYHTFSSDGRLYQLEVGSVTLTFTWGSLNSGDGSPALQVADSGDRMLLGQGEEDEVEVMDAAAIFDHRRLYACYDCEDVFETMCDQGLEDVCYWVPILPDWVSDDHAYAIETLCTKFGKACKTSPEEACESYCEDVPRPAPTPAPVPAPTPGSSEPCSPNPCQNGGSCAEDIGGGHVYLRFWIRGMACQTATSCMMRPVSIITEIVGIKYTALSAFYISIEYLGTWTAARRNVFQSAADRWAEVITHIPCGGSPAGELLITATLEAIDGQSGTLGFAGPTSVWSACPSISSTGDMTFDIADIDWMEDDGIFEGVIMHEMGHVIGVGTLWGPGYGDCATCRSTESPQWACPATIEAYNDLGGTGSSIIELDGGSGTACGHFDEVIFTDELMTGYVDNEMYLSKITAASLDDIDYIVDPSQVDPYILPSERSGSNDETPLFKINDVAVETTIDFVDDDGTVVKGAAGIMMWF